MDAGSGSESGGVTPSQSMEFDSDTLAQVNNESSDDKGKKTVVNKMRMPRRRESTAKIRRGASRASLSSTLNQADSHQSSSNPNPYANDVDAAIYNRGPVVNQLADQPYADTTPPVREGETPLPRFFSIKLGDLAKTVIRSNDGDTWRTVLGKVCMKRQLDPETVKIVACDMNFRELDLDQAVAETSYKDLIICYLKDLTDATRSVDALRAHIYANQKLVERIQLDDSYRRVPPHLDLEANPVLKQTGGPWSAFVDMYAGIAKETVFMLAASMSIMMLVLRSGAKAANMHDVARSCGVTYPSLSMLSMALAVIFNGESGDKTDAAFKQYDELVVQSVAIHRIFTRFFDGEVDTDNDEAEAEQLQTISIQLGRTLRRIRRLIELRWNVIESFGQTDVVAGQEKKGLSEPMLSNYMSLGNAPVETPSIPFRFYFLCTKGRDKVTMAEVGPEALKFLEEPKDNSGVRVRRENMTTTLIKQGTEEAERVKNTTFSKVMYSDATNKAILEHFVSLSEVDICPGNPQHAIFPDLYDPMAVAKMLTEIDHRPTIDASFRKPEPKPATPLTRRGSVTASVANSSRGISDFNLDSEGSSTPTGSPSVEVKKKKSSKFKSLRRKKKEPEKQRISISGPFVMDGDNPPSV